MERKNSRKGTIIALSVLVVVLVGCLALYFITRPQTEEGTKSITVQVVHGDGSTKDFDLSTQQEYLGRALVEGGIVVDDQSEFGLYIQTVDGETADTEQQEWWFVSQDGEGLTAGADATPVTDGGHYELTLTVGW